MRMLLLTLLITFSLTGWTETLKPFVATYDILKDGKKTGQQITKLIQLTNEEWQITDNIKGTHGIASVIGFERNESTTFKQTTTGLMAIDHKMTQKAAFSKRKYNFKFDQQKQQYDIDFKGESFHFKPKLDTVIISSQMMPLSLAISACSHHTYHQMNILKNKKSKDYQFDIDDMNQLTVHRRYPSEENKSTQSLLDRNKQCLPYKQIHKNGHQDTIETILKDFQWLSQSSDTDFD